MSDKELVEAIKWLLENQRITTEILKDVEVALQRHEDRLKALEHPINTRFGLANMNAK